MAENSLAEKLTKAPLFIFNIGRWSSSITKTRMSIGCQTHSHDDWRDFTDEEISSMSDEALEFWNRNKAMLLLLCDYCSKDGE